MSGHALISRRLLLAGLPTFAILAPKAFASETFRTARIIVSLADNVNQGIVPTTPTLGDGQNPRTNLYWGAMYGIKSYFRRHENWTVESTETSNPNILESLRLRSSHKDNFEIKAEAWNGVKQHLAVSAYLGELANSGRGADLTLFVGHNALMDRYLGAYPVIPSAASQNRSRKRKTAVIACNSRSYFSPLVKAAGVENYVMTNGLMAPEAYVVEGVLSAWMEGGDRNDAGLRAAENYAKYQNISLGSAQRIFGTNS